jgi:hypothetical protein
MFALSARKSVGRVLYTSFFKQPHRKKSGAVRSGERGGHVTSPKREITHCVHKRRVGSSTILLKPQGTIVWWKIRRQKLIGHLCVTLRCDCDGFSSFILKEVAPSDSAPNSAPYGNFWVISGALINFVRICLTHRRTAFKNGASCSFRSRRSPR